MSEFAVHCAELLQALGPVRTRRMFGGVGIYVDALFLAIIVAETLYLKADAHTRERFEAAGCAPFRYQAKDGKQLSMSYYQPPEEAIESPALMLPWARLAFEAALRAANAKPAKGTKSAKGASKSVKRQ